MERTYRIKLDFADRKLRDASLSDALDATFIERLCVIDASGADGRLFAGQDFDMVIFDDKYGSEEAVLALCREELRKNPGTILLHVSEDPARCSKLHLIGITGDFFLEYFSQILGFCFLTYLVRETLITSELEVSRL